MMMSTEQEAILEEELSTLTFFLQQKKKEDKEGYYWDTIHYDNELQQFYYQFNPSIWNGTPGIALFFLSLYDYTKESEYLAIAEKAIAKSLKEHYRSAGDNSSLFDGDAGLIYVCLKLFEQSYNSAHLSDALGLAASSRSKMLMETEDDLLGGKAGCLYALTLLYHYSGDNMVLEDIRMLIMNLTATAKLGEQGIGWGNGALSMGMLCGFSHGASGIAHVLLQVGSYFNEPDLVWLAEQAMRYEKQYYVPKINNWMDLRWTPDNEKLPGLFDWTKETFMPNNFDANAWAHGAAGIGLVRLHAYRLTREPAYLTEINAVLARCTHDLVHHTKKSYLQVSGYGGLAEFFMLYSQLFDNKESFHQAITIGLNASAHAKKKGHDVWGVQEREDLGLMTGAAGIGFMLLRILGKGEFDSVLHPTLPFATGSNNKVKLFAQQNPVRKIIYSGYFSQTLELLNVNQKQDSLFAVSTIDEFSTCLQGEISGLSEPEKNYLKDLLHLEMSKLKLWKQNKGWQCFHNRLKILRTELEQYSADQIFLGKKFQITPFVKVLQTRWDWSDCNQEITKVSGQYWNLLFYTNDQIHHLVIGKFVGAILSQLHRPLSIDEIKDRLNKHVSIDKKQLQYHLALQIKELLEHFFIRAIDD